LSSLFTGRVANCLRMRLLKCALVGILTSLAPAALAQEQPILQKGDAVVTGYSGIALLQPSKGAKPVDFAVINQQGASLQVFDLSQMNGRADASLVNAARTFSVTAAQIGQVFGVTLDDAKIPNIYATATSMFGLQLVKTTKRVRQRAKEGGANRTWMGGQFGIGLGGGPGSIWKIDGATGDVSLFANVELSGVANSGPALGNITFDRKTRRLFVSDLQTGMIHALDLDGREVDVFDHGVSARPKLGLEPAAYDPATRVEIASPAFKALQPSTWGVAPEARRVWGVATFGGRLYYSVAEGPEIWSVGIARDGQFRDDARVEFEVQAPAGDAVSDISFAADGTIYLSQRGKAAASFDYTTLAKPHTATVMRYGKRKLASGRVVWKRAPDEYAVGFAEGHRNTNGGHALGYGYNQYGEINLSACQSTLWSTGELLRQNPQHQAQLKAGGPAIVHGLQGIRTTRIQSRQAIPFKTYFIDYDSHHADPTLHGHLGDVAVFSTCGRGSAKTASKPTQLTDEPKGPKGPRIRIAKSCSATVLGGTVHCRVSLRNTGSKAPAGTVGFSDFAENLRGSGAAPTMIRIATSNKAWQCSALPTTSLDCTIAGNTLRPGQRQLVDVVMDVSHLTTAPDWRVRNCAKLDGSSKQKCVTVGKSSTLIVAKTGPAAPSCIAGGPCDFEVSVSNPGKRTFDGPLFFGDNMTIGGTSVGGITVDNVFPSHGCSITSPQLPLEWQCHVNIPPGGMKTFNVLLSIPKGAVPPGVTQGRNCFVATSPHLALSNNQVPANFWQTTIDPANIAPNPSKACVNFSVQPEIPNQTVPPRLINGLPTAGPFGPPILPGSNATMTLAITANPMFFSNPGELITFTYQVTNTGNVPINSYTITDPKVSPALPVGNCNIVGIPIGGVATCTATYTTTPADMNTNIVAPATVSGTW
jgi:hypothetical protein